MAVYIDDSRNKYRGMIMSHMMADSHSELIKIADEIGLNQKHIQYEGTQKEHFDICQQYKNHAIKLGAIEIPKIEFAKMISERDYELYDY